MAIRQASARMAFLIRAEKDARLSGIDRSLNERIPAWNPERSSFFRTIKAGWPGEQACGVHRLNT